LKRLERGPTVPEPETETPLWLRCASAVVRHLPAGRYRLMNALCLGSSRVFKGRIGAGNLTFRCDLRDSIAREVWFTGHYEPQETALVTAILQPGHVFVDVGANWGYFTLLGAQCVGPEGRVVGLEPDPRLFPELRDNVARNGLAQVTALRTAAARTAGTMSMAGFDEQGGNFGLSRLSDGITEGRTFDVSTKPLDDVLDDLGVRHVDLLKMDIEGAEGMALDGLARSLATHRIDRLLLELHPALLAEQGETSATVVDRLQSAGYRPWRVDHSPGATRRAAYARNMSPRSLLQPLDAGAPLDAWPHLLWVAPGMEPLP
jgi:FkbM family methyltransferase